MLRHPPAPCVDSDVDSDYESSSSVFSPLSLIVLIASTLVLSYLMVPSNEEAARRLLNDGQVQRAAAVIRNDGNLPVEPHVETLTDDDRLNLLEAMLQSEGRSGDLAAETLKFNRLLSGLNDVTKVQGIIDRNLADLDKTEASSLYLSLGDIAMEKGRPVEAGNAYAKALEANPSNETLIFKIIQTWRNQNKADRALTALEDWLKNNRVSSAEKTSTLALHISLLRENSKSGNALDLVLPTLHQPPTEEEVSLVEKLAGESSRTQEAVPVLKRYLESLPHGRELVSHELQDVSALTLPEAIVERVRLLANFYEWQDEPVKAFPIYYKLSTRGDRDALKRCMALYDGLDRESDLCKLLRSLPPKFLKPSDERLLARLLAHTGDADAATAHFETYLKVHPDDVEGIEELASIRAVEGDLKGAASLIASALKIDPHNHKLLTEYGDLLISTDRPADALRVYEELSRDPKDDEALERFALLAENLEDPALLAEALTRQIAATDKPCPDLQLALVRVISQLEGDGADAAQYLATAVKESPDQPSLRLALAKLLVESPQPDEALPLLTTNDLAISGEGIELLCSAVQNGADTHKVADFFKAHPESISLRISPEYQDARRQIIAGDAAKAEPGTETRSASDEMEERLSRLRLEAEASFRDGHTAEAYAKISSYFEKTPFAHPSDWNLLGHIYKSMGQSEKSRKAFQKSLQPLTPTPTAVSALNASPISNLP